VFVCQARQLAPITGGNQMLFKALGLYSSTTEDALAPCAHGATPAAYSGGTMPQCCWYSNNTCCANSDTFLTDLTNYFDGYSKKFGYSSENCFYAILSAACFWCDPDSGNFSSNSNTDIYICADWCQSIFMPACNKTLQLADSFCSSPHAVNDTYSQGLVTVNWGNNPETSTCFSPASISQVNTSKCATNYSFTDWGEIIAVIMTVCSFIFDVIVLVALTTFGIMWAIKKRRDEASFLKN